MRCRGILFGTLIVALQVVVVGCHRAPAPQADAPTMAPADEQLDALIIDQQPSMVATAVGECPFDADEIPPLSAFDDSKLPQFDPARNRASNMHKGEGRLDDTVLYQQMLPLQDEVFRCIDIAACYTQDAIGTGELDFEFELGNNGKVRAATVRPSGELDVGPVVSCARLALASLQFPSYDGGNMMVSYQLSIE